MAAAKEKDVCNWSHGLCPPGKLKDYTDIQTAKSGKKSLDIVLSDERLVFITHVQEFQPKKYTLVYITWLRNLLYTWILLFLFQG